MVPLVPSRQFLVHQAEMAGPVETAGLRRSELFSLRPEGLAAVVVAVAAHNP
jgi:hypothetical protein